MNRVEKIPNFAQATGNVDFFDLHSVISGPTISTLFQAFIVAYLVESKNEKKLEFLDELLHSHVVYCYQPALNLVQNNISFSDFVKFLEPKKLKEECSDVRKNVEQLITKRDISSLIVALYATYVAREMGL